MKESLYNQSINFKIEVTRFLLLSIKRDFFLKRMQSHFLSPLNSPNNPNIFIFFKTRTQYKVTGKKSKKSDDSKGVYETTKKRLY